MKYEDLITKLGKEVEGSKMILRVKNEMICIDSPFFYFDVLNRIQRLLHLYGECEWLIVPSDRFKDHVMYRINILKFI